MTARIITAFRSLFADMRDDREAAYTEARRKIERLWEAVHTLSAQRHAARIEAASLRAEIHALEDAAAIRDARLRSLVSELRECAENGVYVGGVTPTAQMCGQLLDDYADVLTPADEETT